MENTKRKKLLLAAKIGLAIALIALVVFMVFRSKQVEVELFIVPSDARATMDGKPIRSGTVSIARGTHKFAAERQYFEPVSFELNTKDLDDEKIIFIAIYPNSPEGETYLATHPEEQLRYERISGSEFSALQTKLFTQYPLTAELPYQTTDFRIDYDVKQDQAVVYLVKLYPVATTPGTDLYKKQLEDFKAKALKWLKDKGVDPSKTPVEFSPDPAKL